MSKLCFFDIDGTIVGYSRVITDKNKEAIRKLRENGHKVILCTGRAPCSIPESIREVGWDAIIASAGSYIFYNDELIYEHAIEYRYILKVFYTFFKYKVLFTLECKDHLYQSPGIEDFFKEIQRRRFGDSVDKNLEAKRMKEDRQFNSARCEFSKWDGTEAVAKITFICPDKELFATKVVPFLDDFHIVYFSKDDDPFVNGEIILKNHTKGDGVRYLTNYLHLSMEDTISFGDSMNDYEMLEATNQSYVSVVSADNLKELADGVFEEPDNDGMYYLLNELGLID